MKKNTKKNIAEFLIIIGILLLVIIIVVFLVYEINKGGGQKNPTTLKWKCLGDSCVYGFFDGSDTEDECKVNCMGPDVCKGIVCQNGGKCENGICLCYNGYSGKYCENPPIGPSPCKGVNCGVHGYCENGKCICVNGYTGTNCNIPPVTDPCIGINCGSHGSCVNGSCICRDGYTGNNCENPPNPNVPPPLPQGITNLSPVEDLDKITGNVYSLPDSRYIAWLKRIQFQKGIPENKGGDYICKFTDGFIPGKYHASSMIFLPDGRLLMVFFGGAEESYNRVSILYTFLDKFKWETPKIIPGNTREGFSNQNPVLFDPNGVITVLYTSQPNSCIGNNLGIREAYAVIYQQQYINGNWTPPERILEKYDNNGMFIKNKVVMLGNNHWVIPGYIFRDHNEDYQFSTFWETIDGGNSYSQTVNTNFYMKVQPSVVFFNNTYYAFMRDRSKQWIYVSTSNDLKNWSKVQASNIPNNNSSIQAMIYNYDGSLLLALNPNQGSGRHNLSLFRCFKGSNPADINSYTKTVIDANDISSFMYPWLLQDDKNNVYISYTNQLKQGDDPDAAQKDMGYYIKWQFLPKEWILKNL